MAGASTKRSLNGGEKLRILLVEDDDADAYLIGRAFLDMPAVGQFIRVRTGSEAVELLQAREFAPDIVFVDLQMPVMNGFEFLLACVDKALTDIPIVVLTSSSSPTDAARSRVRGALRVITKPESVSEMYAVLLTALETLAKPKALGEDANAARARFYLPETLPVPRAPSARRSGASPFSRREWPS